MKLANIPGYGPKEERHHPRSEFSKRLADRLCAEAMDTPSVTQVANRVGIAVSTLYQWLKLGREGDPRYEQFSIDFARARGTHEEKWLDNIEEVATLDDPRAANAKLRANEFLLKKHFQSQYGDRVSVSTVVDNRATLNLAHFNEGQKQTLHAMLQAALAEGAGELDRVDRLLAEVPITVEDDETHE